MSSLMAMLSYYMQIAVILYANMLSYLAHCLAMGCPGSPLLLTVFPQTLLLLMGVFALLRIKPCALRQGFSDGTSGK